MFVHNECLSMAYYSYKVSYVRYYYNGDKLSHKSPTRVFYASENPVDIEIIKDKFLAMAKRYRKGMRIELGSIELDRKPRKSDHFQL